MRRQAFGAPDQGAESSFYCWIAGQRLAKGMFLLQIPASLDCLGSFGQGSGPSASPFLPSPSPKPPAVHQIFLARVKDMEVACLL